MKELNVTIKDLIFKGSRKIRLYMQRIVNYNLEAADIFSSNSPDHDTLLLGLGMVQSQELLQGKVKVKCNTHFFRRITYFSLSLNIVIYMSLKVLLNYFKC